jgi:hypothetical protein
LGGIDVKQLQQSCWQRAWLRDECGLAVLGGNQPKFSQGLEDQPPGRCGGPAGAQPVECPGGGDRQAHGAFDQAENEQG